MNDKITRAAVAASFAVLLNGTLLAQPAVLPLDGFWDFRFEEDKALEKVAKPDFTATDRMTVPGCFDTMPAWLCKRGTGLYRRTFDLEAPVTNAFLVVDGMGLRGKFVLDGHDLGLVALPYSRFELATGPLAAGRHTLFAALDNRFDWSTLRLFLPYYDFYAHGGFYHGVSLKLQTRAMELDRVLVRTRDYKTGRVELEAEFLGAAAPSSFEASVRFDTESAAHPVAFVNRRATLSVPDFKLWSPAAPHLHTVTVAALGSSAAARFGIREIRAGQKVLLLNGAPVYLKGVNRHEAHPACGAATPETLMLADLQQLRALGGNFIRGCHYPQSQRFLDLCDEMGVLVWEESLGWGNTANQMKDPEFARLQLEQTKLMVHNSFNHPSVIIFGFLNENESHTQEGKTLVGALVDAIHAEDSGRLVTFACNHTGNDISNEKTDLIAYNTYPGWIGSDAGEPENLKKLIVEDRKRIVKHFRTEYGETKPIIVSEMGTCGVYGEHDSAAAQWTEEFQAEYVGDVVESTFAEPEICGFTLWQFTDARSYHRGGASVRVKPFALNLAGVLDGYRRPKLAFETLRRAFATKPAGF